MTTLYRASFVLLALLSILSMGLGWAERQRRMVGDEPIVAGEMPDVLPSIPSQRPPVMTPPQVSTNIPAITPPATPFKTPIIKPPSGPAQTPRASSSPSPGPQSANNQTAQGNDIFTNLQNGIRSRLDPKILAHTKCLMEHGDAYCEGRQSGGNNLISTGAGIVRGLGAMVGAAKDGARDAIAENQVQQSGRGFPMSSAPYRVNQGWTPGNEPPADGYLAVSMFGEGTGSMAWSWNKDPLLAKTRAKEVCEARAARDRSSLSEGQCGRMRLLSTDNHRPCLGIVTAHVVGQFPQISATGETVNEAIANAKDICVKNFGYAICEEGQFVGPRMYHGVCVDGSYRSNLISADEELEIRP